jgi:D-glycero-D-manno-heptose 1,7-bisphosphate phosphatase
MGMSRPAIFLDRDGVLNELVSNPKTGEYESPLSVAATKLIVGAAQGAKQLQSAGYTLFIVSNQPNYAKGKSTLEELALIARSIETQLESEQVRIARAFYCYHHPLGIVPEYTGACRCRKPSPQMLFDARDVFDVDLTQSWMIGDQDTDIACGRRAGCRTVLVLNPNSAPRRTGSEPPTLTASDLLSAASKVLACPPRQ